MIKENIKKTFTHSSKKSVFCQISRKKICILPSSKGEKSVYTDTISMSDMFCRRLVTILASVIFASFEIYQQKLFYFYFIYDNLCHIKSHVIV